MKSRLVQVIKPSPALHAVFLEDKGKGHTGDIYLERVHLLEVWEDTYEDANVHSRYEPLFLTVGFEEACMYREDFLGLTEKVNLAEVKYDFESLISHRMNT